MPKPAPGRDFYIATADEIRAGRTTDLYFVRTLDILKKAGRSRANVVAEVTTGALPNGWPWGSSAASRGAGLFWRGRALGRGPLRKAAASHRKRPQATP